MGNTVPMLKNRRSNTTEGSEKIILLPDAVGHMAADAKPTLPS